MDNYNQQQQFSNYTVLDSRQVPVGAVSKKFMANVFAWMFLALGVSALFALLFSMNAGLRATMFEETVDGMHRTGLGTLIAFAPLAFVLVISFGFNRLSTGALTFIFLLFSAAMGMSLSMWLIIFEASSVIGCFASASAMFGVMAVMGYTTDKDLTSFGSILIMGLIGIVIAGMINLFLHSEMMYFVINIISVAIFTGLTAYDVQKLKRIGAGIEHQGGAAVDTRKVAVMGALSIYLDFINIFISLLNLFGKRR